MCFTPAAAAHTFFFFHKHQHAVTHRQVLHHPQHWWHSPLPAHHFPFLLQYGRRSKHRNGLITCRDRSGSLLVLRARAMMCQTGALIQPITMVMLPSGTALEVIRPTLFVCVSLSHPVHQSVSFVPFSLQPRVFDPRYSLYVSSFPFLPLPYTTAAG